MIALNILYITALAGYFGLLTLHLLWHTVLSPPSALPVTIAIAASVVPLLFPLRGILYGRPKAFIWAAFLSLAYFTHGVVEAAGNDTNRIPASLEIGFSLTLFFAAVFFVRTQASLPVANKQTD